MCVVSGATSRDLNRFTLIEVVVVFSPTFLYVNENIKLHCGKVHCVFALPLSLAVVIVVIKSLQVLPVDAFNYF